VKNRSPLAIAPSQASHRLDRERVRELFSQTLRYDDDGVRLGARSIYTDAEIFQLELQEFFEGSWVYAVHESQLPKANDYFTVTIGRQPVLLTRAADGEIRGFLNACAHRGARVCRQKTGSRKVHMCSFHGWTYDNRGKLVHVTDEQDGAYPSGFDHAERGLTPVARLENYRGFIFVSLRADVVPLREYLGGAGLFIDLVCDQSLGRGLEVLPGETTYISAANWKLVAENGLDGYHVGTVHANYIMATKMRAQQLESDPTHNLDVTTWGRGESGFFAFKNGHGILYNPYPNYQDRPSFATYDALQASLGAERADWITKKTRNLLLWPNVFLMDQMSSQIRVVRPLEVGLTEVTSYCIAPVGEDSQMRERRIRQYEDFFNATGMATPDDLAEFRNCQIGYRAEEARWNELSRGQRRWVAGTSDVGKRLGVEALTSSTHAADEGVYVTMLEEWRERLKAALDVDTKGAE